MSPILYKTNIFSSFATDAYKASHFLQLPPKSEAVRFYIAPRKALRPDAEQYITFGIRYFIEKYLTTPITYENITQIKEIWNHVNVMNSAYPFPEEGLKKIVDTYKGFLPITIVGVKEGQVLNQYNTPVFIISVSDSELVWLPGFIETALQRSIWYPSTVATISYTVKQNLLKAYQISVDENRKYLLDYMLHDFGARGASSGESAAIGGLAHLINFKSTDTMEAILLGHTLYNIPIQELASSIPASEHSTVTSWGSNHDAERRALINMIETSKQYGHCVFAFVSDSYNFYYMVDHIWGDPEIIQKIRNSGLSPVVRPDSGDPSEVVLYALKSFEKTWGYSTNSKGFKVLNDIRIIQGDGMSINSIKKLTEEILEEGFSIENICFGMGGGLLQKLDRDSMSWSMKMYKIKIDGVWHNVQKTPYTQSDKKSFDHKNVVDNREWVTHYQWDNSTEYPEIYTEPFEDIRNRTITFP
ncbi:MAG: nicotinate phosphoribosyltransferase [Brevinemataceae bacterium]